MEIRKFVVRNAGAPLGGVCEDNDYSSFDEVDGKAGVYVFQHRDTGRILYVGQSRNLKSRIEQHYKATDTGGNFHANWREKHCRICGGQDPCHGGEDCSFGSYENLLKGSSISFFWFDDGSVSSRVIDTLEKNLIYHFLPEYNSEIMTLRDGETRQDNIDEIIGYIAKNWAEPDETVRNDFADRPSCADGLDPGIDARIDIDPAVCGGRPRIRGTRIRVSDILGLLAAGAPAAEILEEYPELSEDDIGAALAFGARASDRRGADV